MNKIMRLILYKGLGKLSKLAIGRAVEPALAQTCCEGA